MDQFEFSRIFCERPQSYAWFLGAGASRNANLPTADDIITDLKLRFYRSEENQTISVKDMQNDAVRASVEAYMHSRGFPDRWSDEEYTTYFEKIFGQNRERQRNYIVAMLAEEKVQLAVGNRVLGAMLASGLARVVFTTNFDSVVEKSFAEMGSRSLSAFHLEGAKDANVALNNEEYPFYCKLHGDFRYDSVKNLADDLEKQNESLSLALTNAANRFGFVFAGYSGRDQSVMDLLGKALEATNPFPHGIYWLNMKGSAVPEPVSRLLGQAKGKGVTAEIVEIDSFDTMMLRLWRNLENAPTELDLKVRKGRAEEVSLPIPPQDGKLPFVRMNALPMLEVPTKCLEVELAQQPTWKEVGPKIRESDSDLIFTIDDRLLCWGDLEQMKGVFGRQFVGATDCELEADWRLGERLHVKRFLEDGLGQSLIRSRPLLLRNQRAGNCLIVDRHAEDVGILEPLQQVVGKPTGQIPGLSIPASERHEAIPKVHFAESVRISLSWADNRLWLLLKPDVWVWPSVARRYARNFLDDRRSTRKNDKYDELITAWVSILTDDAPRASNISVSAFGGAVSPANPGFTFSSRTGHCRRIPN